jgi:hypothetical protein
MDIARTKKKKKNFHSDLNPLSPIKYFMASVRWDKISGIGYSAQVFAASLDIYAKCFAILSIQMKNPEHSFEPL